MTALRPLSELTGTATTEGEFQTALGSLYAFVTELLGGAGEEALTISAGLVTPTRSTCKVDTEASGTTDDLTNIVPTNHPDGRFLVVRSTHAGRVVTLKNASGGSGQLDLLDSADAVLDNPKKVVVLQHEAATDKWIERWRNWGLFVPGSTDKASARTAIDAASVTHNHDDAYSLAGHNHAAGDLTGFTEAAQDVVGAMIVAAGGTYDDSTGTVALPGSTEVLSRLAFLETNLAITVLRDQIDTGWSVLNMQDGVADEFEDETGILTKTNATYDATGDYYHNPGGYSADVITASHTYSASDASLGAASNAADGNGGTYWSAANRTVTEEWWQVDFSDGNHNIGKVEFDFSSDGGTSAPYWQVWTGSAWVTLYTWAGPLVNSTTYSATFSNAYSSSRYRLVIPDTGSGHIRITEIRAYDIQTPLNMTLVSQTRAADAVPVEARLVLLHQPVGAVTLNTDATMEVSRDGGTTWTQGTLVNEGAFDATTNILTATVSLTGQPSGTSLRWRFKSLNNKEQRLHGVWMQWRA